MPVDRALLALKACVLVVEMATGITENSALWKETLVGQQGLPGFLNARREVLAGDIARRRTALPPRRSK